MPQAWPECCADGTRAATTATRKKIKSQAKGGHRVKAQGRPSSIVRAHFGLKASRFPFLVRHPKSAFRNSVDMAASARLAFRTVLALH